MSPAGSKRTVGIRSQLKTVRIARPFSYESFRASTRTPDSFAITRLPGGGAKPFTGPRNVFPSIWSPSEQLTR